jgi:hypothetical protein
MRNGCSFAWVFGLAASAAVAAGCVGQTGGQTVDFTVAGAGPPDAVRGQPLAFTEAGWNVVLTQATLHVGALYLVEAGSVSGGQATGCYIASSTYVAQQISALNVDLLNGEPQPFPALGHGITDPPPVIGQVWLTGGEINSVADTTPILVVAGTATSAAMTIPFTGTITIGANRQTSTTGAAGGDPICKSRIVSEIQPVPAVQQSGGLLLRVNVRHLFDGIDFSELTAHPDGSGGYMFSDKPNASGYQTADFLLFSNLTSYGAYAFSWSDAL